MKSHPVEILVMIHYHYAVYNCFFFTCNVPGVFFNVSVPHKNCLCISEVCKCYVFQNEMTTGFKFFLIFAKS